jgi:hypothetical protein
MIPPRYNIKTNTKIMNVKIVFYNLNFIIDVHGVSILETGF